jgi:hypothetical protein
MSAVDRWPPQSSGEAETVNTRGVYACTYNHHFVDTAAYQMQSFLAVENTQATHKLLVSRYQKAITPTKVKQLR